MQNRLKVRFLCQAALLAAVICLLSPIAIPVGAVPVTLGSFAVMLTAVLLDWKRAATAVALYLLMGCAGLPVFSGGRAGVNVLVGATGGYLWSYLPMAIVIGMLSRSRGDGRTSVLRAFLGCLLAMLICYALGTWQFRRVAGVDWSEALLVCVVPFVPLDIVKAVCAAVLGARLRARLQGAGAMD